MGSNVWCIKKIIVDKECYTSFLVSDCPLLGVKRKVVHMSSKGE